MIPVCTCSAGTVCGWHREGRDFQDAIQDVQLRDLDLLSRKLEEYGSSWKARGGVGAFMNLARTWDRLEVMAREQDWDIFKVPREVLEDQLRDLRCYALLIEMELEQ